MPGEKLVFLNWESPPHFIYGGQGVYLDHLLEELGKKGYNTTVIGCSPNPNDIGKTIQYSNRHYTTFIACRVTDLFEDNIRRMNHEAILYSGGLIKHADMVVVSDFHLAFTTAVVKPKNTPIMLTHSFFPHPSTIHLYLQGTNIANSRLTAQLVSSFQRFLAENSIVSLATLDDINPKEPEVIYPAVPRETDSCEPKKPPELDNIDRFVLAFMRNQYNKGYGIVRKTAKLMQRDPELKEIAVVVAGRGWRKKRHGNLIILGETDCDTKKWLMQNAEAGIMPSDYEPFGMVALEYIYHGTPAITSINSGVNEVLEETAVTFKPQDPENLKKTIQKTIQNKKTIVAKQQEKTLKRTWKHVAEEFLKKTIENTKKE